MMQRAWLYYCLMCLPGLLLFDVAHAENQALLIGINHYQNVKPDLQGIERDIQNIKSLAINQLGFKESQVHVLQDQQATKKAILDSIKYYLIDKTKPNDQVLFYFSGHGYYTLDDDGDEQLNHKDDRMDETLVPSDTYYDFEHNRYKNMITDDELRELLDQIDDRRVTVILDSCHSGTGTRGIVAPNTQHLEKTITGIKPQSRSFADITATIAASPSRHEAFLSSTRNRTVWSAVASHQNALIDFTQPDTVQSVFTRWFIDGLLNKTADSDKNGRVSNVELLAYTRQKSEEHCQNAPYCHFNLTPILKAPDNLMHASLISQSGFTFPDELLADSHSNSEEQLPQTEELVGSLLPETHPERITIEAAVNGKKTTTMHMKDSIFLGIKSKKSGYLLLLDRTTDGKLKQLFPNPGQKQNVIHENKYVSIPRHSGEYEIRPAKAGDGQLIAIVTHDKINMDDIIEQGNGNSMSKDIVAIPKQENYLAQIAQRLYGTWTGDSTNRSVDFAIATFDYTVLP